MSSRSTKIAAALIAVTAGAGTIAASPALARGGDDRRPAPQRPGSPSFQQPGTAPGAPLPGVGVIAPDRPTATAPGTGARQGLGPGAGAGDPTTSPRVAGGDTWLAAGTRRGRSFRVSCEYVRSAVINPVLLPGQEPGGHEHQFFGGLSINKDSTPATLVAANVNRDSTSCGNTRDGSTYWQDSLINADDPNNPITLEPDEVRVRYAAPRGQRVRAFPVGFTMVGGDRSATTLQANAGWRCEYDAPGTPLQATPPTCEVEEAIVGVVRFPNCWDGTTLTSTTLPQPHVAYRTGRTCPTTHPVALPELTEEVFWMSDGQPHEWKISGATTAGIHAAFMNGWDQRALRNQVRRWLGGRR